MQLSGLKINILTSVRSAVAVDVVGIVAAGEQTKPAVVGVDKSVGTLLKESLASVALIEEVTRGFMSNSLSSGAAGFLTRQSLVP